MSTISFHLKPLERLRSSTSGPPAFIMTSLDKPQDRVELLEAEIERRLAERFAALREEFDRLRLESDRRWAGFLSRFDQRLTGVVPAELLASAAGRNDSGHGLAPAAEAGRALESATSQA